MADKVVVYPQSEETVYIHTESSAPAQIIGQSN